MSRRSWENVGGKVTALNCGGIVMGDFEWDWHGRLRVGTSWEIVSGEGMKKIEWEARHCLFRFVVAVSRESHGGLVGGFVPCDYYETFVRL